MSVQTTQAEIARAKLVTGLIALAIMATSCAPQMISAKVQPAPAASAAAAK